MCMCMCLEMSRLCELSFVFYFSLKCLYWLMTFFFFLMLLLLLLLLLLLPGTELFVEFF